ncbi:MAG: DUF3787 domain-containing protein [Clostridiales bacterium]|jgi:hypothetical protein|nr:DUF3787 domain-containing protein [Clostridiales bacterium]
MEEQTKEVGAFKTYAVLEEHKKDKESGVTKPSLASVKEAKDWVDNNPK